MRFSSILLRFQGLNAPEGYQKPCRMLDHPLRSKQMATAGQLKVPTTSRYCQVPRERLETIKERG